MSCLRDGNQLRSNPINRTGQPLLCPRLRDWKQQQRPRKWCVSLFQRVSWSIWSIWFVLFLILAHRNGSYYYSNSNGSTYYNDGKGSATYTPPSGKKWILLEFFPERRSRSRTTTGVWNVALQRGFRGTDSFFKFGDKMFADPVCRPDY